MAAEVPEKYNGENKNENENELADGIISGVTQERPIVAGVSSGATNSARLLGNQAVRRTSARCWPAVLVALP